MTEFIILFLVNLIVFAISYRAGLEKGRNQAAVKRLEVEVENFRWAKKED